jgi:hypothetical protein
VDVVGPWKVKTPSGTKTLRLFTATYPATSWPEIEEKLTNEVKQLWMMIFIEKYLITKGDKDAFNHI